MGTQLFLVTVLRNEGTAVNRTAKETKQNLLWWSFDLGLERRLMLKRKVNKICKLSVDRENNHIGKVLKKD